MSNEGLMSRIDLMFSDSTSPLDSLTPIKNTSPGDYNDVISTDVSEGHISPLNDNSFIPHNLSLDNEIDSRAAVVTFSKGDQDVAKISCDIAKSESEKRVGLQSYDGLSRSSGLLFPYKYARDVLYHMGAVSFPIDILFVGKDNKVKRVYENITPGTLATFGSAGVKNVIEIAGGMSSELGISKGDSIQVRYSESLDKTVLSHLSARLGLKKNAAISFLTKGSSKIRSSSGVNILPAGCLTDSILKTSELITSFEIPEENGVSIYVIDDIISPEVICRKRGTAEDPIGITIFGKPENIGRRVRLNFDHKDDVLVINNYETLYSSIASSSESLKMFNKFNSDYRSGRKVVLATSFRNKGLAKSIFLKRASYEKFGSYNYENICITNIDKTAHGADTINGFMKKYGESSIIYSKNFMLKGGSSSISEEITQVAKSVLSKLDQIEKSLKQSSIKFEQNVSEYLKIEEDLNAVKKSKGMYFQSVKRNTEDVKGFLILIRDAIKGLNDIKDITTSISIIGSMANSAKLTSEAAEEVFDLINSIEEVTFVSKLSEKTSIYSSTILDFLNVIEHAKNYVSTDILGITLLSS